METTLKELLLKLAEEVKPEMIASFKSYYERSLARLKEAYGPSLKVKVNFSNDYMAYSQIRPWIEHKPTGNFREEGEVFFSARFDAAAEEYAEMVTAEWTRKVSEKLVELENPSIRRMSTGAAHFQIEGTRKGRKVVIEQIQILKWSKRGKMFHQWPARIYVDGKFISEANYKKMTF